MGIRRTETVKIGKRGRFPRPHIGPDDAVLLHHRIGRRLDLLMHPAALGLTGLFNALARAIKMPAMKRTAQPVILKPPKTHIRPAMRTAPPDQAQLSFTVAKQHQILTQKPHRRHRACTHQLVRKRRRLPVPAQHFARITAGADLCQAVVKLLTDHELSLFVCVHTILQPRSDCQGKFTRSELPNHATPAGRFGYPTQHRSAPDCGWAHETAVLGTLWRRHIRRPSRIQTLQKRPPVTPKACRTIVAHLWCDGAVSRAFQRNALPTGDCMQSPRGGAARRHYVPRFRAGFQIPTAAPSQPNHLNPPSSPHPPKAKCRSPALTPP